MYRIPELNQFPELVHGTSEKEEGNMSFKWGPSEEVLHNRERFLGKIGIQAKDCVGAYTCHGTEVLRVNHKSAGEGMKEVQKELCADAFLTEEKNLYLFLLTGDCLPIIFYDPIHAVAGIAHASRHNTPQFLMKKVLEKMEEWFKSRPEDIVVGIGPSIKKDSYIFSQEICEELRGVWEKFSVETEGGKCALDVAGWNIAQLLKAGVPSQNIFIAPRDTVADAHFFSHRRSTITGEPEGRIATVVGIKRSDE